jgi:hypothetical protein
MNTNTLSRVQAECGLLDELWLVAVDEACTAKDAGRRTNELLSLSKLDVVDRYFSYHPGMKRWAEDHVKAGTCEAAIRELQVQRMHLRARRAAERREQSGRPVSEGYPDPSLDWMKSFRSGPSKIEPVPEPDPLDGDYFNGRDWPLASLAINYVAATERCSHDEACLRLKERLREGRVRGRGPFPHSSTKGMEVQEIDSGFWRYTVPGKDGDAADLSSETYVPWFEVYLPDVLTIWPLKGAQPATESQTSQVAATARQPAAMSEPSAHEVPTGTATSGGIEESGTVAVSPVRRGRRAVRRERVRMAMLNDLRGGSLTVERLRGEKEEVLADEYKASRETCRKARQDALSVFVDRQIPTSDN